MAADAEGVLKAARAMASEIAANSPIAVQGTKAVLAANEGRTVAQGLDYVATWNAGMLASDDLVEAVTAFMEKRSPKFTGRSRREPPRPRGSPITVRAADVHRDVFCEGM